MHHSAPPLPRAPGPQTTEDFARFAADLDAVGREVRGRLGEQDGRYIRALLWTIRGLESLGRALLTLAAPWWPGALLGAILLGLSKCLENMEFGHNVMHGQYDWLNDPRFMGKDHDWDNTCAAVDWRDFHNFQHHHFTNVLGKDRDFGYGMLRLSADTPWEPRHLMQGPYTVIVALAFEWAIAIHNMEVEQLRVDRERTRAHMRRLWPHVKAKMARQARRDYLLWPVLAGAVGLATGHGFWPALGMSLGGHVLANVIRNVWSFAVIFCGHFTDQIHTFDPADLKDETRGQWYLRQCLGSANVRGGWLFHVMSGNLSHQIEHHLYPDLPARRYAELAPRVRAICERHGVPYNTGSLARQFSTVAWRILRHSFPGGQSTTRRIRPYQGAADRDKHHTLA